MLHFLRFLVSKVFLINLLIALLLVGGGIYAILSYLDDYTLHAQTLKVPNLVENHVDDIDTILSKTGNFSTIVTDSVFIKRTTPGTILEQDPTAETTVKQGRKIYLTIAASQPSKISMPNLVDMSLRQATSLLETFGLEIGTLTYKADLCKNCIIEQQINGKEIEAGERIERGLPIDLVVGQGLGNELTAVPYLIGMTAEISETLLKSKSLNIGGVVYDEETVLTAEDSLKAQVYRQIPFYSEEPTVRMGSAIDIFLTTDTNLIVYPVNSTDSI